MFSINKLISVSFLQMKKILLFLLLLAYVGLFFMCYNKNENKESANTHKIWYIRKINQNP